MLHGPNNSTGRLSMQFRGKKNDLTRGTRLAAAGLAEAVQGELARWIKFDPTTRSRLLPRAGELDRAMATRGEGGSGSSPAALRTSATGGEGGVGRGSRRGSHFW